MERVHCMGNPLSSSDRPRSMVVKFLSNKDKLAVLQRAKSLRGTKIFINEDYTEAV